MTQRILIIRLSALGDILHGLPVLAALRHAFPDARIGWLVEDRGAPLLAHNPILDRLHVLPRHSVKKDLRKQPLATLSGPLAGLARQLREERYTISIDLQGLTKSAIWGPLSGAGMRIGFRGADAREMSRWFYNEPVAPPERCVHIVEKHLALLKPLGVTDPSISFPFRLDEATLRRGRDLWNPEMKLEENKPPRVILNVGAGWPTKMWPAASFGELGARLVKRYGACIAVAWGPGEEAAAEAALAAGKKAGLKSDQLRRNGVQYRSGMFMAPATTFMESGGMIAAADLYVGGDTGPTHMAAALGIPVVSPFGASDAKRNRPLGTRGETLQLDDPPCIPCWKTECTWKEPLACLTHITVDRVYGACTELLD